jgi:hypothetical protein
MKYLLRFQFTLCTHVPSNKKSWVHVAVHDMEVCWWILIYLAIMWQVPGGHCREELRGRLWFAQDNLSFFDGPGDSEISMVEKQQLFTLEASILESDILSNFHPYFEPLKLLVHEWYNFLLPVVTRQILGFRIWWYSRSDSRSSEQCHF